MPNLVSSGSTNATSSSGPVIRWDPKIHEIFDNDIFYGFQFDPATARLTIQEIDDNTTPIQLPDYRIGDGNLSAWTQESGTIFLSRETLLEAQGNLEKHETLDAYNTSVYINWLTSQSTITFSWYTNNKSHLILEVN